jgi:hypothetical protein
MSNEVMAAASGGGKKSMSMSMHVAGRAVGS